MFAPKRWSLDCQGVHKLLYGAIQTTPMDSRRSLYKYGPPLPYPTPGCRNIYVAGGVSLLANFAERVETELEALVAQSIQVNVSALRAHNPCTRVCR
jgi:actin-related protein